MDKNDIEVLAMMLEKYELKDISSALSYACSERALYLAERAGDPAAAKLWMWQSIQVDHLTWKLEKGQNRRSGEACDQ